MCMGDGWDTMPESTIASPYVHSRVDSQHIYHGQPYARVHLIPMPESTLSPSQEFWIWPLVYPPWTSQNIDNCFKCHLCL
jgi:hypothetical protein